MSYDSLDCRAVAQTLWGMLFVFFNERNTEANAFISRHARY